MSYNCQIHQHVHSKFLFKNWLTRIRLELAKNNLIIRFAFSDKLICVQFIHTPPGYNLKNPKDSLNRGKCFSSYGIWRCI